MADMAGKVVKYAAPADAAEAAERFLVLEDRGDRYVVASLDPDFDNWAIRPTQCFSALHFIEVSE